MFISLLIRYGCMLRCVEIATWCRSWTFLFFNQANSFHLRFRSLHTHTPHSAYAIFQRIAQYLFSRFHFINKNINVLFEERHKKVKNTLIRFDRTKSAIPRSAIPTPSFIPLFIFNCIHFEMCDINLHLRRLFSSVVYGITCCIPLRFLGSSKVTH